MKRMIQISFAVFFVSVAFFAVASAQEKKSEKHIKVVIADDKGSKVIIDTVFTGDQHENILTTKDGKVIVIDGVKGIEGIKGGSHPVTVTVHSDENGNFDVKKEIRIVTGDSMLAMNDGKKVIVRTGQPIVVSNEKGETFTWVESGKGGGEEKVVVYARKGEHISDGEAKYDIEIKTDKSGVSEQKVNFVMAKDGIVVNIEGSDEAKVKELKEVIEKHLGIGSDETRKEVKVEVSKKDKK